MKKSVWFIGLVLLVSLATAVTVTQSGYFGNFVQNQWNTSNSVENLTFAGGDNQTLNVNLPKYVNVTSVHLNLSSSDDLSNIAVSIGEDVAFSYGSQILEEVSANFSEDYVIFIEADYLNETAFTDAGVNVYEVNTRQWLLWEDGTDIANSKALIYNDIYTGSNPLLPRETTNITKFDTSEADDFNKTLSFHRIDWTGGDFTTTVFFNDTSTNYNVSAWYQMFASGFSSAIHCGSLKMPTDTFRMSACDDPSGNMESDALKLNNPDGAALRLYPSAGGTDLGSFVQVRIMAESPKYYTLNGDNTYYDSLVNYSIPRFGTIEADDFNLNGSIDANLNITPLQNYLNNCTADVNGYCVVPFIFSSDTAGVLTSDISSTINYSLLYNVTYEQETIEKDQNTFFLRFFQPGVTGFLVYNGSNVSTTTSSGTSETNFTSSFRVDWVDNTTSVINETKGFHWNLTFNNTNGLSDTYEQLVYKMALLNYSSCLSYPTTLNFTVKDEVSDANVVASFEASFDVWHESASFARNNPFDLSGNSTYPFCIYPSWVNYTLDATISYTADGYSTRNYYFDGLEINNVTQNVDLYLLNTTGSTDITFNILDVADGTGVEGAIVTIERCDIGSGVCLQVDRLQTDDNGQVVADMVLDDVFYRIIVTLDGNIKYTSPIKNIHFTPQFIYITVTATQDNDIYNTQGINHYLLYSDDDEQFRFFFNDPDGVTSNGCLEVRKITAQTYQMACNTCSTAASATLTCDIPLNSTGEYIAVSKVTINGNVITLDTLSKTFNTFADEVGNLGVVFGVILIAVIGMMGLARMKSTIVLTLVGIGFAGLLGFWWLGLAIFIEVMFLGLILLLWGRT